MKLLVKCFIFLMMLSLPSWERGLKSFYLLSCLECLNVAPLVGAWIEIFLIGHNRSHAPSLPSWERGLKCCYQEESMIVCIVAPLVGAWIEITPAMLTDDDLQGRSPRGSVD